MLESWSAVNNYFEIFILGGLVAVAMIMLYVMFTEMTNFVQTKVPFVPTARKDLEDIVARVGITEQDVFYDLGSGNGKVIFVIAELTGAKSVGLQRAGWTQTYAKIKKYLASLGLGNKEISQKIEFKSGNFFHSTWSPATVIYAYLYPFLMSQVAEKAKQDCPPGTKFIVRDFPILEWEPKEVWDTPSGHTMHLYIL